MATKSKTPAVPVDERKHFLVRGYRLSAGSKKLELFRLEGRSPDSPFTSKEETLTWSRDFLSRPNQHTHHDIDGVLVFESVAAIRPKKVEIEIDEIPHLGS